MAKIWCEKCTGSGKKTEVMSLGEGVRGIGQARTYDCPTCHGAGYTEAEVVEVDRIMWLLQESTMWENSPAPGKYRRIDMGVFNKLLESLKEAK